MRLLDETLLDDIVIGATILGSGGGGDPYIGKLLALQAIRQHGPVSLVGLDEVADEARLVFIGAVGAPGVLIEKLPRPIDAAAALDMLEAHLGYKFTHLAPIEAGGLNAVTPVSVAAVRGLPIADADGMGRAWPTLDLVTPTLYGGSATPLALADEHGNRVLLTSTTNEWSEIISRAVTVASGGITLLALYPMTGVQAKRWLVHGPLTRAARLGELLRCARPQGRAVDAILADGGGVRLLEGKVTAVERRTERGWTMGEATVDGIGHDRGRKLVLQFQNEYLAALVDEVPVATTPDLIMTLGLETGEPIPAEQIRYGYRVSVIGLPGDSRWRSPEGLQISGPRRFGYDLDYRPVESSARLEAQG